MSDPPSHEFKVFSVYDGDNFETTFVNCDNCGVVHKVIDICRSEIIRDVEDMTSILTLKDIKASIPQNFCTVLEQYNVDLPTWQHVSWILEEKKWGEFVTLTSEYVKGTHQGKIMVILGESLFKINNFTNETVAG